MIPIMVIQQLWAKFQLYAPIQYYDKVRKEKINSQKEKFNLFSIAT